MSAEPIPDPCLCPLCGGDNRCAMEVARATGEAQEPCWCTTQVFSPQLLARLHKVAAGKACICARCVAALSDERSARNVA